MSETWVFVQIAELLQARGSFGALARL